MSGESLTTSLSNGRTRSSPLNAGTAQRGEVLPRPEQPGVHGDPVRLPGLVVQVHLADGPDLVALRVHGPTADVQVCGSLRWSCLLLRSLARGWPWAGVLRIGGQWGLSAGC